MSIAYSRLNVAQYAALSVAEYAALRPSSSMGLTQYLQAIAIHAAGAVARSIHLPGAQATEIQQS